MGDSPTAFVMRRYEATKKGAAVTTSPIQSETRHETTAPKLVDPLKCAVSSTKGYTVPSLPLNTQFKNHKSTSAVEGAQAIVTAKPSAPNKRMATVDRRSCSPERNRTPLQHFRFISRQPEKACTVIGHEVVVTRASSKVMDELFEDDEDAPKKPFDPNRRFDYGKQEEETSEARKFKMYQKIVKARKEMGLWKHSPAVYAADKTKKDEAVKKCVEGSYAEQHKLRKQTNLDEIARMARMDGTLLPASLGKGGDSKSCDKQECQKENNPDDDVSSVNSVRESVLSKGSKQSTGEKAQKDPLPSERIAQENQNANNLHIDTGEDGPEPESHIIHHEAAYKSHVDRQKQARIIKDEAARRVNFNPTTAWSSNQRQTVPKPFDLACYKDPLHRYYTFESSGRKSAGSPPPKERRSSQSPGAHRDPKVKAWKKEQVFNWMVNSGLEQYWTTFAAKEIDGASLLLLTREDLLKEMGIPLGGVLKILAELESVKDPRNANITARKAEVPQQFKRKSSSKAANVEVSTPKKKGTKKKISGQTKHQKLLEDALQLQRGRSEARKVASTKSTDAAKRSAPKASAPVMNHKSWKSSEMQFREKKRSKSRLVGSALVPYTFDRVCYPEKAAKKWPANRLHPTPTNWKKEARTDHKLIRSVSPIRKQDPDEVADPDATIDLTLDDTAVVNVGRAVDRSLVVPVPLRKQERKMQGKLLDIIDAGSGERREALIDRVQNMRADPNESNVGLFESGTLIDTMKQTSRIRSGFQELMELLESEKVAKDQTIRYLQKVDDKVKEKRTKDLEQAVSPASSRVKNATEFAESHRGKSIHVHITVSELKCFSEKVRHMLTLQVLRLKNEQEYYIISRMGGDMVHRTETSDRSKTARFYNSAEFTVALESPPIHFPNASVQMEVWERSLGVLRDKMIGVADVPLSIFLPTGQVGDPIDVWVNVVQSKSGSRVGAVKLVGLIALSDALEGKPQDPVDGNNGSPDSDHEDGKEGDFDDSDMPDGNNDKAPKPHEGNTNNSENSEQPATSKNDNPVRPERKRNLSNRPNDCEVDADLEVDDDEITVSASVITSTPPSQPTSQPMSTSPLPDLNISKKELSTLTKLQRMLKSKFKTPHRNRNASSESKGRSARTSMDDDSRPGQTSAASSSARPVKSVTISDPVEASVVEEIKENEESKPNVEQDYPLEPRDVTLKIMAESADMAKAGRYTLMWRSKGKLLQKCLSADVTKTPRWMNLYETSFPSLSEWNGLHVEVVDENTAKVGKARLPVADLVRSGRQSAEEDYVLSTTEGVDIGRVRVSLKINTQRFDKFEPTEQLLVNLSNLPAKYARGSTPREVKGDADALKDSPTKNAFADFEAGTTKFDFDSFNFS